MRLHVEGVEVWRGLTFLGIISGDWLAAKVQEQLDTIEISEWLRSELAADPTRRLGPPIEDARPLRLPAPAYVPITKAVRVTRRAQRQKNKGRKRKKVG